MFHHTSKPTRVNAAARVFDWHSKFTKIKLNLEPAATSKGSPYNDPPG
jgi:hypothetical protein